MSRATVPINSPGANGLPRCGRPQNKGGSASRPWAVTKTNGTLRASSTSATGYNGLATEIDVEHRCIEALARSGVERRGQVRDRPDHLPADRLQYLREQCRNEKIVFDDQYSPSLPHPVSSFRCGRHGRAAPPREVPRRH